MTTSKTVDVIILNLNETSVVLQSLKRLKRESWNIIVVDNGSDDVERLYKKKGWKLIELANKGSSVGRNAGLSVSKAEYVFLLDGDILYIPGSIDGMLQDYPLDAACVGVHNRKRWNGTRIREEADIRWNNPGELKHDFPMAWTQYGLFRGDLLRKVRFNDQGIFGKPGVGYEDDWLYQDIVKRNHKSYYYPYPLYYHEAHGGRRYLKEKGLPINDDERLEEFKRYWDVKPWHEKGIKQEGDRVS